MALEVKVYRIPDFIRWTKSGELDRKASEKLISDLAGSAMVYPDHNILVDLRDTTVPKDRFNDVLELAADLASNWRGLPNRIANVIPDSPDRFREAKVFEACLELHGFVYRVFTDYAAAIEWLSNTETLLSMDDNGSDDPK